MARTRLLPKGILVAVMLALFVCPVTDTVESDCRTLSELLQRVLPGARVTISAEARAEPRNLSSVSRRLAREGITTVAVMAMPAEPELIWRFRGTFEEWDPTHGDLPAVRLIPALVRGEQSPWSPGQPPLWLNQAGVRRLVADVGRLLELRPAKLLSAFEAAWPDAERELTGHIHAADLRRAPREADPVPVSESGLVPRQVVQAAVRDLAPTLVVDADPLDAGVVVRTSVPTSGQELLRAIQVIKASLAMHGLQRVQVRLTAPLRLPGGVFLPPVVVCFDGSVQPRRTSRLDSPGPGGSAGPRLG